MRELLSQLGLPESGVIVYVVAFVVIFALLTLLAFVLRRLTGGRMTLAGQGGRTRQPRLGIVDVYDLDRQRQLILLRRDNVEHLLLIGGPNDVVIETNIVRVPGARLSPSAAEASPERIEPAFERSPEIAPSRPVIEPTPRAPAPEPNGAAPDHPHARGGGRVEPRLEPQVVAVPEPSFARPRRLDPTVETAPERRSTAAPIGRPGPTEAPRPLIRPRHLRRHRGMAAPCLQAGT
jgi:flagellar protein FliO/FliZ